MKFRFSTSVSAFLALVMTLLASPTVAQEKPNILVIWADDIGWFNVSAYNRGMMTYRTPNIDRIANDGILFTDAYGQNSCTAGRSAFILGQRADELAVRPTQSIRTSRRSPSPPDRRRRPS